MISYDAYGMGRIEESEGKRKEKKRKEKKMSE